MDLQLLSNRAMPCLMTPAPPENTASDDDPKGAATAGAGFELAPGVSVPEATLRFVFVRSSGPGGQNVNKRATKAQLRVTLADIPVSNPAKARLARLAGSALTDAGELLIQDEATRSAARNRRACLDRLRALIVQAQTTPKVRRPTKPSRGSVRRRLDAKKQQSDAKKRRKPPDES